MLKKLYSNIISYDGEKTQFLSMVKKLAHKNSKILDVGCGYGRFLAPLQESGYQIVGLEKNLDIVKANNQKGLNCLSLEAFEKIEGQYDIILLSHIIEHFNPDQLLPFLDYYLARLANDGYLMIATPLYSNYFYDDFDHVKPYHPQGLQMIFSGANAQVQYYSRHQLALRDLWFRKSPLCTIFHRAKYFKSPFTRILQVMDLLMVAIFRASLGLIGKKDGWIGVFQKV